MLLLEISYLCYVPNSELFLYNVYINYFQWLTERKKRALLKKNVDLRRRIELVQEFDMPGVSTSIRVSKDGQYIMATGIYKPRIKCFDVNNLSLKFERCLDSEVVTFEILSDDYTKVNCFPVFLMLIQLIFHTI